MAEPTDQAERRERYAAALYATLEVSPTRHPWETLSPFRRAVWYARADAAMAVADTELRQAQAEAYQYRTALQGAARRATAPVLPPVSRADALDLLSDVDAYLCALHLDVDRHDNIGADGVCGGCLLRERVAAALPTLTEAATPTAARADEEQPATETRPACPDPESHNWGCGCPGDRLPLYSDRGVDTPGCDCGHKGMGMRWHATDCEWIKQLTDTARELLAEGPAVVAEQPAAADSDEEQSTASQYCNCRSCWGWFVQDHLGEDLDELGQDLSWWSGLPAHRDAPAGAQIDEEQRTVSELPDYLVAYFAKRDKQRADAVTTFLGSLTDRERALVHDVAVMGYVQGLMRSREDSTPKDSEIVHLVIDACFAFPDKYPAVATEPDR